MKRNEYEGKKKRERERFSYFKFKSQRVNDSLQKMLVSGYHDNEGRQSEVTP